MACNPDRKGIAIAAEGQIRLRDAIAKDHLIVIIKIGVGDRFLNAILAITNAEVIDV